MAHKKGKLETPDYTEEIVGFALESFLAFASFPHFNFSIEPFSKFTERRCGADARLISDIEHFKPFYMQFKRPFAYPGTSKSLIIKDRKELNLSTDPKSLFFELRKKKLLQKESQHNLLFNLRKDLQNNGGGDAAYVCPLFLNRKEYRQTVYRMALASRKKASPFTLKKTHISTGSSVYFFENILDLSGHISIPPHVSLNSEKHKYSFNERGGDVCFHPLSTTSNQQKKKLDYIKPLSLWLKDMHLKFQEKKGIIREEDAKSRRDKLINSIGLHNEDINNIVLNKKLHKDEDNGIKEWLTFGDYLHREYNIEQYAFIQWRDKGGWRSAF